MVSGPTHAGGIVYREIDREVKYLIVTAKKNPDHWVFPKGHIEGDETPQEAAEREVAEEAGVRGVAGELVGTIEYEAKKGTVNAVYFLMEYAGDANAEDDRTVEWCSYEDAMEKLSFDDTQKLLDWARTLVDKQRSGE